LNLSFYEPYRLEYSITINLFSKIVLGKTEGRLASLGGDGMHFNKTTSPIPSITENQQGF
jgi:hypothetical protein